MNKTKKGLMRAGGILAIVFAGILIFAAIIYLTSSSILNVTDLFTEAELTEMGYTTADLQLVTDMLRKVVIFIGIMSLILAALDLVFGIRVILDAKHLSNRKHNIITLLVVNAISGSLIVVGFMIAALCMKFKSAEQLVDEAVKNANNQN